MKKLYGIHSITEALDSGVEFSKVFIQKNLQSPRIKELIHIFRNRNIPFSLVPQEKLDRLTTKPHQGLIALTSEVTFLTLEQIIPMIYEQGRTPLILILDGITDVRNIGAIARSAECFSASAMVIPTIGVGLLNEDAIKSSAGALLKVPVCRETSLIEAIKYLKNSGLQIIAANEKSTLDVSSADYTLPTAIVLGDEGSGVSDAIRKLCDAEIRIDMSGTIKSLNVSVSAGILLFNAHQQRKGA